MCGGPENSNSVTCHNEVVLLSTENPKSGMLNKDEVSTGDAEDDLCLSLLELAANNDLAGFKREVERGAKVDAVGSWYGRQNGTNQMVLEQRTPLMIASMYGSVNVLDYILNYYRTCGGDINRSCGSDGSTALHCAAAGGPTSAVETVTLLLNFGADPDVVDALGRCPVDVIMVSPKLLHVKKSLERILKGTASMQRSLLMQPGVATSLDAENASLLVSESAFESLHETDGMGTESSNQDSVPLTTSFVSSVCSSPEVLTPSPCSHPSPSSSPKSADSNVVKELKEVAEKSREYPVDPYLPDIKNSIYTTDEFRMFSFKVRPCSRAYSHDWTECPFVHPGENARRRDPRRCHYSCVPCPDFRKGSCRRGDACEYAHGVFECWLHPAQYRTRLCKDGTSCSRRVCFFAHTTEELRPLYVSAGSTVLSPRSSLSLDMASLCSPLAAASPSSLSMIPPFSPTSSAQGCLSTPPMSPSSFGANSLGGMWQQPTVPTLHLPGVGLHSSRLRASLSARDLPVEDLTGPSDVDGQLMCDFTGLSTHAISALVRLKAAAAVSGCGSPTSRAGKYGNMGFAVSPTNLEELFASEMASSPRTSLHESSSLSHIGTQMQSHNYAQSHSQLSSGLQPQMNSQLLPQFLSQKQLQVQHAAIDSQIQGLTVLQSSLQPSSFSPGSLGSISSLSLDDDCQNSNGALQSPSLSSCFGLGSLCRASLGLNVDMQNGNVASLSPAMEVQAAFSQQDKNSHGCRDLGADLAWSSWGSPTGKPEWGVQKEDLCKFRKSTSVGFRAPEDQDLSWVQNLVKDGPLDTDSTMAATPAESTFDGQGDIIDHSVLGSWVEQMHLDQIVA